MRETWVPRAAAALAVAWLTVTGLLWAWSGLSIVVGSVSGACETIVLRAFGPFTGHHGGSCLAIQDRSSWDVPGGLAAIVVLLVGFALLAAAIWVWDRASVRFSRA